MSNAKSSDILAFSLSSNIIILIIYNKINFENKNKNKIFKRK